MWCGSVAPQGVHLLLRWPQTILHFSTLEAVGRNSPFQGYGHAQCCAVLSYIVSPPDLAPSNAGAHSSTVLLYQSKGNVLCCARSVVVCSSYNLRCAGIRAPHEPLQVQTQKELPPPARAQSSGPRPAGGTGGQFEGWRGHDATPYAQHKHGEHRQGEEGRFKKWPIQPRAPQGRPEEPRGRGGCRTYPNETGPNLAGRPLTHEKARGK